MPQATLIIKNRSTPTITVKASGVSDLYKDQDWFDDNPDYVLKAGQKAYLLQTGQYKLGDGTTTLDNLEFLGGIEVAPAEVAFGEAGTGNLVSSPRLQFAPDVSATYARLSVGGSSRNGQVYINNVYGSSTILENDYLTTSGIFNLRPQNTLAFQFTAGGYIYGDTTKPYVRLSDASGTYIGYSTGFSATETGAFFGNGSAWMRGGGILRLESGSVATDLGIRIEPSGVKIAPYSQLGIANTYPFEVLNSAGGQLHFLQNSAIESNSWLFHPQSGMYRRQTIYNAKHYDYFAPQGVGVSRGWFLGGIEFLAGSMVYTTMYEIDVTYTARNHSFIAQSFSVDLFAGTGDRLVESDSVGKTKAEIEIRDTFIVDGTVMGLLENTGNWTAKEYTGTAITGTYEGQMHFDNDYWFLCVSDNNWIRIARA